MDETDSCSESEFDFTQRLHETSNSETEVKISNQKILSQVSSYLKDLEERQKDLENIQGDTTHVLQIIVERKRKCLEIMEKLMVEEDKCLDSLSVCGDSFQNLQCFLVDAFLTGPPSSSKKQKLLSLIPFFLKKIELLPESPHKRHFFCFVETIKNHFLKE